MFKKLIVKYNLNVHNMLKNGTIAVFTMAGTGILFGDKNIMLAFPVALTSAVMGRQNFYVKPFSKTIRIMILDLVIVFMAYLSSINLWVGIIINFFTVFSIMYMVISPYDLTFYKPFLMLYVFTQYARVSINELPNRIYSVIFGVAVIAICNFIGRSKEKALLGKTINKSLSILQEQIKNIENGINDKSISEKCSNLVRSIAYRLYVSRHKKYLTTNLGRIQFKIFICIENINLYLSKIDLRNEEDKNRLAMISQIINNITEYLAEEDKQYLLELNDILEKNNCMLNEVEDIIRLLVENIKKLVGLSEKDINKVYAEWERASLDRPKTIFFEYLHFNSIRFKFAMRMAITMSIVLFGCETLGYYKIIWAAITIMSIMQPYYEDTITKAKDRIRGNVIAVIVVGISIELINNKIFTIIVLVISLYLLYGFKEYSRISLFAAAASISIASLSTNVNKLIAYRVIYVMAGVILVLIANKFIFPYRLDFGIKELMGKITRYNNLFIQDSFAYLEDNVDENEIRDLIIHITLLLQKLYIRNKQYKNKEVGEFISINNRFIMTSGYKVLFAYGKNREVKRNIEDILRLYQDFNNKIII